MKKILTNYQIKVYHIFNNLSLIGNDEMILKIL